MTDHNHTKPPQVCQSALTDELGGNDGWAALDRYRTEMIERRKRLEALLERYLRLDAFDGAYKVEAKIDELKHNIGRIPLPPNVELSRRTV